MKNLVQYFVLSLGLTFSLSAMADCNPANDASCPESKVEVFCMDGQCEQAGAQEIFTQGEAAFIKMNGKLAINSNWFSQVCNDPSACSTNEITPIYFQESLVRMLSSECQAAARNGLIYVKNFNVFPNINNTYIQYIVSLGSLKDPEFHALAYLGKQVGFPGGRPSAEQVNELSGSCQ